MVINLNVPQRNIMFFLLYNKYRENLWGLLIYLTKCMQLATELGKKYCNVIEIFPWTCTVRTILWNLCFTFAHFRSSWTTRDKEQRNGTFWKKCDSHLERRCRQQLSNYNVYSLLQRRSTAYVKLASDKHFWRYQLQLTISVQQMLPYNCLRSEPAWWNPK